MERDRTLQNIELVLARFENVKKTKILSISLGRESAIYDKLSEERVSYITNCIHAAQQSDKEIVL